VNYGFKELAEQASILPVFFLDNTVGQMENEFRKLLLTRSPPSDERIYSSDYSSNGLALDAPDRHTVRKNKLGNPPE